MKFRPQANKIWIKVHVAITLIAYAIGILWIIGWPQLRILFLEVWWLAVMTGTLI